MQYSGDLEMLPDHPFVLRVANSSSTRVRQLQVFASASGRLEWKPLLVMNHCMHDMLKHQAANRASAPEGHIMPIQQHNYLWVLRHTQVVVLLEFFLEVKPNPQSLPGPALLKPVASPARAMAQSLFLWG